MTVTGRVRASDGTEHDIVLPDPVVSSGQTFTVGETNPNLGSVDDGNANLLIDQGPYPVPQDGYIQSLSFGVVNPAGQLRLSLYDSAGNLLAQTAAFTPVAGINTQPVISSSLINAGTQVYPAYNPSSNGLSFPVFRGPGVTYRARQWPFGPAPAKLPAATETNTVRWCLYATLSAAPVVSDTIPPSAPANLAATATGTTVSLSWSASTDNVGVAGYKISRNGVSAATTQNPNYTDSGLQPNTSYTYAVRAFDAAGNESAESSTQVTTGTTPPPPSEPLVRVGLYTWDEIVTRWQLVKDVGFTTLRVATLPDNGGRDDVFMACLNAGCEAMPTLGEVVSGSVSQSVAAIKPTIDLLCRRYGPGGAFWTDHPTAPVIPIRYIELLNEPNFGGLDPALCAHVVTQIGQYMQATYPGVGLIAPTAGDSSAAARAWLVPYYAADPGVAAACAATDETLYSGAQPPDGLIVESWGSWHPYDNILWSQQKTGKPFWITETGQRINHANGGYFADDGGAYVTPIQQAAYNIRMDLAATRWGVPRVYHMFIIDTDGYNGGYWGPDNAIRPVSGATKQLISMIGTATSMDVVEGGGDNGEPFVYKYHRPDGVTVIAAWAQTPKSVPIAVPAGTVVYDMMGVQIAVTTGSSYTAALSETPIWLRTA